MNNFLLDSFRTDFDLIESGAKPFARVSDSLGIVVGDTVTFRRCSVPPGSIPARGRYSYYCNRDDSLSSCLDDGSPRFPPAFAEVSVIVTHVEPGCIGFRLVPPPEVR